MRTRWIVMLSMLALALALCVFSVFYVQGTMDELDEMCLSTVMYAEDGKIEDALVTVSNMLTTIERKSMLLEILTPHDDLHDMIMQLTDAQVSLSIEDMDDFEKAVALFREIVDHIRTHEQPTLSNIL